MTIEERKAAFYFIRDIPYKIGLTLNEQDYCCSTKAEMLAKLLNQLGLKTRFIICKFEWEKTPLPQTILDLPREPDVTHMFLQTFIPETNSWINCDPTWDIGLKNSGFDIEEWDGINSTGIAVKSTHIYSPEESVELIKGYSDIDEIKKHLESHTIFYKAINKWFATERQIAIELT